MKKPLVLVLLCAWLLIAGRDAGARDPSAARVAFERARVGTGQWERNEDVRNGLAGRFKEAVRVYSWIGKHADGSLQGKSLRSRHFMIVPRGVWMKDRHASPPFAITEADTDLNIRAQGRFKGEIRGFGKWLATSTSLNTLYFDLSRPDPKTAASLKAGGEPKGTIYINEGWVRHNKHLSIFDIVLLPDAMLRAGYTELEVQGAVANAKQVLGDQQGGYEIAGSKGGPLGVIVAGKSNAYFWPEIRTNDSTVDPKHAGTVGDGTAFDKAISAGQDAALPAGPADVKAVDGTLDSVTRIAVDGRTEPTAALYASKPTEEGTWPANYYLMFRFKNNDAAIMRTGFLQVFGGKDMPAFPGVGILKLAGATEAAPSIDVSGSGKITFLGAKSKGVYAFYETRMDEADKALKHATCVGPVLWWGVSDEVAKEACKNAALP